MNLFMAAAGLLWSFGTLVGIWGYGIGTHIGVIVVEELRMLKGT